MKTEIWAHRGASGYAPENTLESFALAIQQNADAIELDVQFTKDRFIVVAHDEKIDRVSNGKGYIKDYTLEELKTFNFNKKFDQFGETKIPTLWEVYNLVKPHDIKVNVEFKTARFPYPGIEEKVMTLTRQMHMDDRVIYSSFNHFTLVRAKKINPDIKTGMLIMDCLLRPEQLAKEIPADAVHPPLYYFQERDLVKVCKENNLGIRPWTVNEEEHMKMMFEAGADAIITNYPDVAYKLVQQQE